MDFFDVISKRASYRGKFRKTSVPEADLEKILKAGLQAPSGYNLQTTRYYVVTSAAVRLEIARLLPTPAVRTAPVILVPVSIYETTDSGLSFETEDYGASVENVLLAAAALGYACVWMDGQVRFDGIAEKLEELLELPAGEYLRAVIPLGIPEEEPVQKEKKPLSERVVFIR